jgi:3-oxoacyl-[acyl-carrier protein] reductase
MPPHEIRRLPAANTNETDHDHPNQQSCHHRRRIRRYRRRSAERLAKDGFTVVVNYAGNAASAQAVVARIEAAGGRAVAAQADISDVAAVARMFDSVETAFGGVDILINNAWIMNLAIIKDSDDALFDRHIAVNLKGTFNTLREAARRLRDGGRIINFSSSVTSLLQPTYGIYAATKAAVEAMTSILAKELRGRNWGAARIIETPG